jgi:hypothetical protein
MARAHFVKKAQKDYKDHGIKRGQSYWWWKFAYGSKRFSKTPPKRSQLTQSGFYATMYDAEDALADATAEFSKSHNYDQLASDLESIAGDVRSAGEECADKKGNMPDSLQEGSTGQLLETRAEQCEQLAADLETAASDIRDLEADEEKSDEDKEREAIELAENVSWDYE